jgi:AcrR family transcriptional regulator
MSSDNPKTRTRILQSALTLLESGGGNGVRMADIAKQAGISRQAVYQHFPTRAELLIATTLYVDEINDVDARLAVSRGAGSGIARLDAYIEAWGNYIPEVYGISKALLAMKDTDDAAAAAWEGRMQAMREGCAAAIKALKDDGKLAPGLKPDQATDLLWTLLSVRNWEQLTIDCGWPQKRYIASVKRLARQAIVIDGPSA